MKYIKSLCAQLSSVDAGTFATTGKVPESNPGLVVNANDLGRIGLPLSERDARSIQDAINQTSKEGELSTYGGRLEPEVFNLVNPGDSGPESERGGIFA